MKMINKIKELYQQIPEVRCIKGCSRCCGVIPWSTFELELIPEKKEYHSINCPYLEDHRCTVYEQRPFICRIFGATQPPTFMSCPYGASATFPLTPEQAKTLTQQYHEIVRDNFIFPLMRI